MNSDMMGAHEMGEEMMGEGKGMGGESYPGIAFTPPPETVGDETEGQALVTWKKVGDGYTITEFEGKPIGEMAKPEMTEEDALSGAFSE